MDNRHYVNFKVKVADGICHLYGISPHITMQIDNWHKLDLPSKRGVLAYCDRNGIDSMMMSKIASHIFAGAGPV